MTLIEDLIALADEWDESAKLLEAEAPRDMSAIDASMLVTAQRAKEDADELRLTIHKWTKEA
jgi:hypothetical protein